MYFLVWKCLLLLPILSDYRFTFGIDANTANPVDTNGHGEKVWEGTPVNPPHSRPYIVQIGTNYTNYTRSGVIIDQWTVITTAVEIKLMYKIFAGKYYLNQFEKSQQERDVCWWSPHPKYGSDNVRDSYCYGILRVSEPFVFNEFVQPAIYSEYNKPIPTSNCKIAGWGQSAEGSGHAPSPVLLERNVSILSPDKCWEKHETLVCISRAACTNDWGSPVTCTGKSGSPECIGYVAAAGDHCANAVIATMAKLSPAWLNEVMEEGAIKCRANGPDCCNNAGKINGDPVIPHSRPYVVQIHYKGSKEVAIGVLINAYTIVTSAHKLKDILKVTAGKHLFGKYEGTQQTRRPCLISQHTNLDKPANAFAYGLIHLSDPFVLNEYVNGISIAPKGAQVPKENCSITGWQGNTAETELREQSVKFKDPKTCKNQHETIACVEAGACLHDWGSPVICSHDSKIYFQAIASSADAYCKDGLLASIPALPRDWLATELRDGEAKCARIIQQANFTQYNGEHFVLKATSQYK